MAVRYAFHGRRPTGDRLARIIKADFETFEWVRSVELLIQIPFRTKRNSVS